MFEFFDEGENFWDKAFIDIVLAIALIAMAMVLIMIVFLNDPGKEEDAQSKAVGNIMIELHWDDDVNVDLDSWVMGPGDEKPVGFRHRADKQFNLIRDDRGLYGDITNENYENVVSRGIKPGRYYFNVHWYGGVTNRSELPIRVVVSVTPPSEDGKSSSKQILARGGDGKLVITPFEDINVFVFELDAEGNLVPGSVYEDPELNLKSHHGVRNRRGR